MLSTRRQTCKVGGTDGRNQNISHCDQDYHRILQARTSRKITSKRKENKVMLTLWLGLMVPSDWTKKEMKLTLELSVKITI